MTDTWTTALDRYQERINARLEDRIGALPDHAPQLKAGMRYALLMGGKRVRPALVYATGEMLGLAMDDLDVPAIAIECIHAYSLVHDDLPAMDDDDLRRGQPTCHIAFDDATAILAGDALQTLAFEQLSSGPLSLESEPSRIAMLRVLSQASGYLGMCGGQAMDLAATDKSITLDQLEQLHSGKTGALIRAAMVMPAAMAKLDDEQTSQLASFANLIGLAFQVQDDILDVIGNTQTLGKPQGSDTERNKSTYPALLGLEGAKTFCHELHQKAIQALTALPYNTQQLQSFSDFIVQREF